MVFSSVDFLFLFLPVFLLVQFLLPFRNITYAAFSLLFYFIGEGWYTAIIMLSAIANFAFGLAIQNGTTIARRKSWVAVGVSINLALLFFFKYATFFASNFMTIREGSWIAAIHLPLGISFFTFHAISYLVDIYRREADAETSFVNLSLYMLMFPQLIAGPILRFHTVADQLHRRFVTVPQLYQGAVLFCLGLGQKVLLADTLAGIADPLFSHWQSLSMQTAWLATIAYALQIFFDFAGYSNMAIGLGWMTGFSLPRNFDAPYVSRSITEFWRRWHMSLSRWFRDYLYVPLGGNRHGELRTYRNLLIVFLLCGLWHGAAWTFVIWGLYHGVLLIVERLGLGRWLERGPVLLQHGYTLLAVGVGWVLFRSDSIHQALSILGKMFFVTHTPGAPNLALLNGHEWVVLAVAIALSTARLPGWFRKEMWIPLAAPQTQGASSLRYAAGTIVALLLFSVSALKVLTGAYSPFIYFRF